MTNEELATRIKNGETDLIPELWNQVSRFVEMCAYKIARKVSSAVFDAEDLIQSGYFALIDAIKYFEPNGECKFITYLSYTLKTAFAECGGWKSSKEQYKWQYEREYPPRSLDAPLSDDDTTTLEDITPCPCNDCERIIDRIYIEQLHDELCEAIDKLPPMSATAIKKHDLEGEPLTQIAEREGVSYNYLNQCRRFGLMNLARDTKLKSFVYSDAAVYSAALRSSGLQAFKHSGSSTERIAIAMAQGKPINGVYPRRGY